MLKKRIGNRVTDLFICRKEFHNFNGLLSLLNGLSERNLPSESIKLIIHLVTSPMMNNIGFKLKDVFLLKKGVIVIGEYINNPSS